MFKHLLADRNDVVLTLGMIPLYLAAIGKYGFKILIALGLCVLIGLLVEWGAFRLRKMPMGLFGYPAWCLFPLVLPPVFPLWMTGITLFFGLVIGVAYFGGHGRALASPVAISWAFAALSFPFAYNLGWALPFPGFTYGFTKYLAAVLTTEHPLETLAYKAPGAWQTLLAGNFPQPVGNAIPAVVLVCGLVLLIVRAIDTRGCLSFFATVVGLTVIFHALFPTRVPGVSSLLVGEFLLAGFLIVSDNRIAPRTPMGRVLIGILTGLFAFLIRNFSAFPDGVFFAVLLGNVFAGIVDEGVLKHHYKHVVKPV